MCAFGDAISCSRAREVARCLPVSGAHAELHQRKLSRRVGVDPTQNTTRMGGGGGGGGRDGTTACQAPLPGSQTVPCLLNVYESSRYLVIYFHSNAEDLGLCRWFCRFMYEQFQVHVLAVEYPGYGVCPGRPTPEGVIANAHAALQFVHKTLKLPLDRILVFGRSLGTGPAVNLASRFTLAGLVLVTPFMSVKEVLRSRIGSLADLLKDDFFENHVAIREVNSPTLVIHGKLDDIIPVAHGEAIYQECMARKGLVCPPELSHNSNITLDLSIFVMPMLQFFSLPECCFDELEVPDWIFDTSHEPLFGKLKASESVEADDLIMQMTKTHTTPTTPPLAVGSSRLDIVSIPPRATISEV
ncbi:unnamed protein product [Durusdinium trenchii]|uniref:Alpha/beta hydrolase domain-containing protein 17A (Abhydrolase domain-containing protein 17A) n=2 Tax=Durusdinium trenchii TaxID=1381693 RepID=A0ABP0QK62_9DINO